MEAADLHLAAEHALVEQLPRARRVAVLVLQRHVRRREAGGRRQPQRSVEQSTKALTSGASSGSGKSSGTIVRSRSAVCLPGQVDGRALELEGRARLELGDLGLRAAERRVSTA